MLTFVEKYGSNIYSQNGEDGIIAECLKRMGITTGHCVEFGAADGLFCSNTFNLLKQGWTGTMFELDSDLFSRLKVNIAGTKCIPFHQAVTPNNINLLLPKEIDVLSIDTDSDNDYYCWEEYSGSAKIVVIEINSSVNQMIRYLNEGANYRTMVELGIRKGYFLFCHTGNLVFVRNEFKALFPEITGHPLTDEELYFNKSWLTNQS